ncbi:hypothetical protein BS78_05G237700 [Paspalum vaginatum]|nr:hypothetical protein BS78_05G237700 [Paspalum vaginatum]
MNSSTYASWRCLSATTACISKAFATKTFLSYTRRGRRRRPRGSASRRAPARGPARARAPWAAGPRCLAPRTRPSPAAARPASGRCRRPPRRRRLGVPRSVLNSGFSHPLSGDGGRRPRGTSGLPATGNASGSHSGQLRMATSLHLCRGALGGGHARRAAGAEEVRPLLPLVVEHTPRPFRWLLKHTGLLAVLVQLQRRRAAAQWTNVSARIQSGLLASSAHAAARNSAKGTARPSKAFQWRSLLSGGTSLVDSAASGRPSTRGSGRGTRSTVWRRDARRSASSRYGSMWPNASHGQIMMRSGGEDEALAASMATI